MSNLVKYNQSQTDIQEAYEPIKGFGEESSMIVEQATFNARNSFLQKLFPNETTRAIQFNDLMLIRSEMEFRRKAVDKLRATQIQALTEACNQYLIRLKAESRANTAQFLMQKNLEIQKELDRIFEIFIVQMESQLAKCENIQNSMLKKMRETQLERDIEGFMQQQQLLMEKFRRIISEN